MPPHQRPALAGALLVTASFSMVFLQGSVMWGGDYDPRFYQTVSECGCIRKIGTEGKNLLINGKKVCKTALAHKRKLDCQHQSFSLGICSEQNAFLCAYEQDFYHMVIIRIF
jgi:hypothetical protein